VPADMWRRMVCQQSNSAGDGGRTLASKLGVDVGIGITGVAGPDPQEISRSGRSTSRRLSRRYRTRRSASGAFEAEIKWSAAKPRSNLPRCIC